LRKAQIRTKIIRARVVPYPMKIFFRSVQFMISFLAFCPTSPSYYATDRR
jgi:hypothetical protein